MGKIALTKVNDVPVFRKVAMGTWSTVGDPSVYGVVEIDMTNAIKFMHEQQEKYNIKLSPLHLVAKAAAHVLVYRPEINGIISMSRIYQRKNVDIFFQINVPGIGDDSVKKATLSGFTLRNVDKLSIKDIAMKLSEKANEIRQGKDELKQSQNLIKILPWWLVKHMLNFVSFLNYDLNLNLKFLGIPGDPFGSIMITNVGSLGIDMAWAPLVPYSRVPLLLTVGSIQDTPWVVDGKVEVRPIMKIGVTFDHRLVDGVHAAAMARHFKRSFAEPEKHLI